jgi:uncharacterized protein
MAEFYSIDKPKKDLWYKEPWMLLVLGGPIVVVIASIITGIIAWHGADNVVSQDYYKQGVNINKNLYRDAKASEYQMLANAQFDPGNRKITLRLEGKTTLPAELIFSLSVANKQSEFESAQKIGLTQTQSGLYEGQLKEMSRTPALNLNLWHVQVDGTDWRLTADWHDPAKTSLQLKP